MLDLIVEFMNSSRLFAGLSTMGMQIGSRYMMSEIPSNMEKVFNKPFFRRIFLFFVVFLAFRDVKWAMLITLLFILTFNYLLDEKSKIYIGDFIGLERKPKEESKDRVITVADLQNAKEIITIYNQNLEKQKIKLDT